MIRLDLLLLTIFTVMNGIHSRAPTVETKLGTITGVQHNVSFRDENYTVDRFLGIPYAKPPTGNLRFRKPVAYGNFSNGTLMATKFGNSCAQMDTSGFESQLLVTTEDCLVLNIFVPIQSADKASGHAVMVYIHGGGLVSGTSRRYLGDTLAAYGNVIVVTMNYRLWLFGFLNLQSPAASGNMGFWDQHMAIQWVHENINSFGGDPDRVTIFGQSAGSISASLQSLYPGNHGLFNGVITESGSPFISNVIKESAIQVHIATLLASKLLCDINNITVILECLQSTSVEKIMQTLNRTMVESPLEGRTLVIMGASVDGEFIKEKPRTLLSNINSAEVQFFRSLNLINGFNSEDGVLSAIIFDPNAMSDDFSISREAMNAFYIPAAYKRNFAPGTTDLPEELVELIAHEYTDWNGPNNPMLLRDRYLKMNGDMTFGMNAVEYSRLHAGGTPSANNYLYMFEPATEGHIMPSPSWIHGAAHGDELPFLFGFPPYLEMKTRSGSVVLPKDREFDLSERMMTRWTHFAKTGDPNTQGEQIWPTFKTASEEYMKIDWNDTVDHFLLARETSFWYSVLPQVRASLQKEVCTVSAYVSSASCVVVGWSMIFTWTISTILFYPLL